MIGIYKITNLVNKKIYIGSSSNLKTRIKTHKNNLNKNKHINQYLQNAWNKYGEENFMFEIIEKCSNEIKIKREQYWLDFTKCYIRKNGYNICKKADSPQGYKHTEESKKKMSFIKKEQIVSGKIKTNLKHRKNFKHSEETKEKIRQSKLGENNPMYGKKLTEKEKQAKSDAMNSVPKWNKGKTKEDDPRIAKLAVWKNKLPPNAVTHSLIDLESNEIWKEKSLFHLSKITPISLSTLNRLKNNKAGIKITKKYKLIW